MEEFRPLQLKHYLIFIVANEKFAIDIVDIESIHTSRRKNLFDDINDLRLSVRLYKRLVPLINLRKKLRLHGDKPEQPALIFLKCPENPNESIVGIQVDQTVEIIETLVPKKSNGKKTRLIKAMLGINQEVIMVLRIKDIVGNDKLIGTSTPMLN